MASKRTPKVQAFDCAEAGEVVLKLSGRAVLLVLGECAVELKSRNVAPLAAARGAASVVHDLRVQRALKAMQREPERRWSVAALAKLAGASRAAFAKAFLAALGCSPRQWLREQRLELARTLLSQSDAGLAEIAERSGYANEFGLSRAFKRRFGVAPGRFRRGLRTVTLDLRCAA